MRLDHLLSKEEEVGIVSLFSYQRATWSRHTATDSSEDERSEFELGGRRELRVLGNKIRLVAMRPGVTPVLIPNTKVKA